MRYEYMCQVGSGIIGVDQEYYMNSGWAEGGWGGVGGGGVGWGVGWGGGGGVGWGGVGGWGGDQGLATELLSQMMEGVSSNW